MIRNSLVFLALPWMVSAQLICALGPNAAAYKSSTDQRPTADAMELAGRVNAAAKSVCGANCPATVLFRNNTAPNALLMADNGHTKLVYSPQFFSSIYEAGGDAAVIAIIAHELGHALDDTLGAAWIKPDWTPELRADSWAGCILAKSDFNAKDLDAALTALESHPSSGGASWNVRRPVIQAGYTACGGGSNQASAQSRKP